MDNISDIRAFFEDSVIGSFDEFLKETCVIDPDWNTVSGQIDTWNLKQIQPLVTQYHEVNGLELHCGRRIFVIAANPKPSPYPVRVTHYFERQGALCECEADSIEQAIIECLVSYPDSRPVSGMLDQWMNDNVFAGSFRQ